jgi:hypothetical protein
MTQRSENETRCLVCEQNSESVPLIAFQYQGRQMWICPQHLPILIHKPTDLASRLPGAENMEAAAGLDD